MGASPVCWICRDAAAVTREHKINAADLKLIFNDVSQLRRLHIVDETGKRTQAGSVYSDFMKFEPSLCQRCNSTVTQPHDRAWFEMLVKLRNWNPALRPRSVVRGDRIYSQSAWAGLCGVHLHFAKKLGCWVQDNRIDGTSAINTDLLADAILFGKPYPGLLLRFGFSARFGNENFTGGSKMLVDSIGNHSVVMQRLMFNGLIVEATYADGGGAEQRLDGQWNPRDGNTIKIVELL